MRGGCHGSQAWVKNYDVFHGTDDLRFRIHGSSMAGYQLYYEHVYECLSAHCKTAAKRAYGIHCNFYLRPCAFYLCYVPDCDSERNYRTQSSNALSENDAGTPGN